MRPSSTPRSARATTSSTAAARGSARRASASCSRARSRSSAYSNFALSDSEQANGYSLMCRAMPEQDLVVELLHYDPDNYRLEHRSVTATAVVAAVEPLTHDIVAAGADVRRGVRLHARPVRRPPRPGRRPAQALVLDGQPPRRGRDRADHQALPGRPASRACSTGGSPSATELGFTGPYGALRAARAASGRS